MVMCFVPGCNHYSERKTCKFLCFPADQAERKKWIDLIRRKDREPSKHSLVCSCHFVNMDRKNRPTLFEFNADKKLNFPSPEKRKRTAKAVEPSIPSTSAAVAGPSRVTESISVEVENYFLKQDNDELSKKVQKMSIQFSYEHIKNNEADILMYTGIPTDDLFMIVFQTIDKYELKYYSNWQVTLVSKVDQLLMTLMKLRLNLPHRDLAIRFNCCSATVTNIVMTWIYALHHVYFKQLMKEIPPKTQNQACLPAVFLNFKDCRVVLDCTEISSAIPSSMDNQRLTYSSYKHRNTWKYLVGVAPNGVVTYASKAYPGSTSDKKIVEHCGILEQLKPGDLILADKGFLIQDLLPDGVSLNIPPFLSTPQFTELQVYETQRIAKARIHVERAIRRIKCFSILDRVPQFYTSHISIIFQLCAALTNFQYPLIKEVQEYYC